MRDFGTGQPLSRPRHSNVAIDDPLDEYECMRLFIRRVNLTLIYATKLDINSDNAMRQWAGWTFLLSQEFDNVCVWCGLDPDYTRRAIIERAK